MLLGRKTLVAVTAAVAIAGAAPASAQSGQASSDDLEALRAEIVELRRRDEANRQAIQALKQQVEALTKQSHTPPAAPVKTLAERPAAPAGASPQAALDAAIASSTPAASGAPAVGAPPGPDVWSGSVGGANVRLMDISMDVLTAGGWSSVGNDQIESLEQGDHDPHRRGFTLQQVELSFAGAVDPYFTGESHIIATPDGVELEEAFATTTALPHDLQLEAGYFFTEFGVMNPRHPHQWDWVDQPVINSRLMGGEGLRSAGFRLGWLLPTPWYSQIEWGLQSADIECCTTGFLGDTAGGRPQVNHDVNDPLDLLWLGRLVNSWDFSSSTTGVLGLSTLYGPNDTGSNGTTWIYGTDFRLKWRPPGNFRGYPFVTWQTEVMARKYKAAGFTAGTATEDPDVFDQDLPGDTLDDQGGYTQLLWGFQPGWAAGLRAEYATGSGQSVEDGAPAPRNSDPLRDDRVRLSPLLSWSPSHFSRLRLQYNFDDARHLDGNDAHTVWLGLEIGVGAHAAHDY
jgi:hypothetical protein